ncbi:unnamed protein product [Echinostoma caproni]|uniref:Uncharacterized protein n=1 Tax=Echinostoma caproni TaxID=27848 RepID=A0A183A7V6_9TREM|nr:unnamed protein product [Echinostoma caproni]
MSKSYDSHPISFSPRRPRKRKFPKSRFKHSHSLNRVRGHSRAAARERLLELSRPAKSVSLSPNYASIKWNPPLRREHVNLDKTHQKQYVPVLMESVEKLACLFPPNGTEKQESDTELTI